MTDQPTQATQNSDVAKINVAWEITKLTSVQIEKRTTSPEKHAEELAKIFVNTLDTILKGKTPTE